MLKDKLKSKKMILVLVILILLGGVAYLVLRNSPYFSTLGWKTYTNKEYGYEFKHPKGWTMRESTLTKTVEILLQSDSHKIIAVIDVWSNPNEIPIKDWLSEKSSDESSYRTRKDEISGLDSATYPGSNLGYIGLSYIENNTIVDGVSGIDLVLYKNGEPTNRRSIIIPKGKEVYVFSSVSKDGSDEYNTFKQLLSTFKFP